MATREIYGVLVAGSAMLQEGYVIPIRDIFDDIQKSTKARELRLPTMNDALCLASRFGNVDLVKSLLAAGVDINGSTGSTEYSAALLEAADHEQLQVMEILLSRGARLPPGQRFLPKELESAGAHEGSSSSKPRTSSLPGDIDSQLSKWVRTLPRHESMVLGRKSPSRAVDVIVELDKLGRRIEK